MNRTGRRSLDVIAADPRVLDIEREDGVSDSRSMYTITLVPGWHADGCHYPCENSVRELLATFRILKPCACAECQAAEVR